MYSGGINKSDLIGEGTFAVNVDMSEEAKYVIKDFMGNLNEMAKGASRVGDYFDSLENVAARLVSSLQRFKEAPTDQNAARKLINDFNAVQGIAASTGENIEKYFKGVRGGWAAIEDVIQNSAQRVAGGLSFDGITKSSVEAFHSSAKAVESWGVDVKAIIDKTFSNSTVDDYRMRLEAVNKTLAEQKTKLSEAEKETERYKQVAEQASRDMEGAQSRLRELQSGEEFQLMKSNAEKYEEVLQRNLQIVRNYMDTMRLASFDEDNSMVYSVDSWGLSTILERVAEGSLTADEAIIKLNRDYRDLIGEANAGDLGLQKIRDVEIALSDTKDIVTEIRDGLQGGTYTTGSSDTFVDRALGNSDEIRSDAQTAQEAQKVIVDALNSLATAGDNAGMEERRSSITKLVESISALAGLDINQLNATSDILRRLTGSFNLEVSNEQVDKLAAGLKRLAQATKDADLSSLLVLTNIRLDGFNGLNISKASLSNLATYLPLIANADIGKLKELESINLSNFNKENLSVSKASFDHLRELIDTLRGTGSYAGAAGKIDTSTMDQIAEAYDRVEQEAREEAEAVQQAADHVVQAQQNEAEVIKTTADAAKEHDKDMEAAAKAEEEKAKISELLAKALEREEERTKSASKASKEHADAVEKQMDAMWAERRAEGESLNGLYDSEKIEGEISRAIAERIKQKDAETAAAEKAQRAWEKEEQAKLAAEEKAAKAAEEAARRKEESDRKAAEASEKAAQKRAEAEARAAEKALREQQKLEEAQRKAEQLAAYKDASRTVNRYYGLLTSKDTNASKRQDVTMTEAGWVSASGKYAELAAQLNDATAAYNMLTDAQNKNGMSAEQVAEINAMIATRQKDYNLAVENAAAKEKESAERAAESARAKAQQAEETQKAKEAKRQEAEATKAQAQAEKEEAAARSEAERSERQYTSTLKQINNAIVQCENAQRKYAFAAKLGVGKEDYSKIQNASKRLSELRSELERTGAVTPEIAAEFRKLSEQVSTASANLKTNGGLIGGWATTGVEQLKSRLTYSLGLAAMVYKAAGEIKKMISTAVELDTAMNQLQIVTRSSSADMDVYAKRVSSMAKETAQATKDLIDATTVYARLGYSIDESAELAKRTAQLQGVGGIDPSAAQDAMTAILKAFNKNVDDVEDVMNKLVVVGNNFPISVSQLAEGMNNAGSMLAVAGNSLEQSIALLTAANTTVQDISKASTGLRTIAARIRKTKTELDDLGEAINESKYEEMIQALAGKGVSLTDAEGQYRSTYNVLKDIARVWNDLGSMDQAAVIEALAGTRQQNVFSSLITQFQEAEGAMDSMQDSAGELEEAYGIYLDSIEAHTKTLKAAFDELSRDFVDSDLAKGVIDFLTVVVGALDTLIEKLGGVGALLSIVAGSMLLKLVVTGELATVIAGISTALTSLGAALMGVTAETLAAEAAMAGTSVFGVIFTAIGPQILAVVAALAALTAGITIGVKEWKKAHPTLDQLKKDAKDTSDNINKLSDSIEKNKKRIKELYEIKEENGELTEKEQDELDLLEKQNEQLEQQKQLLQQIMEYKNAKVVSKAGSDTLGFFNNSERETLIGIGAAEGNIYQKNTSGYGGLLNALSDYAEAQEKILSIQDQIKNARLDGTEESARTAEKLMDQLSEAQGEAAQYAENIAEFQQWLIERRGDLAGATDEQSIEALHQIDDALRMIGKTTGKDKKYLEDFKKDLDKLSGDTLKKLLNGLELTSDEVRELMKWMDEMGYSVEDAAKFFNEYCNEIRDASKAQEELDPGKSIGDLTSLQDELSETTEALEAYKKAMEGGEKGDAVKEMADIYKGALEDLKSGRVDSRRVHNAAELFFSQEQLAEMDYDMAEIGRRMQNSMLEALFDPSGESEQSYGQRFAKYIENNASKFAKAGAAVEKTAEGYRFHYDSLQQLADAFGISREACSAFLDDLDAYGVEVMRSTEENIELSNKFVDIQKTAGGAREAVVEFIKQLSEAGRDSMEIREILADLSRDGVIQLSDEEVKKILQETMEGLSDVDSTKASPEVTVDADGAFNTFRTIEAWINYLNRQRIQIEVDASGTTKVGTATSVPSASKNADTARTSRAAGGVTGKAGPTLVNELGPELISDKGKAFIANHGEPGFVNLSDEAIVFTADETKEIAKNGGLVSGGSAYADGTRKSLIGRLLGGSDVPARANTWVCKICGSRNDPSATRCWKCKNVKGASNTAAATAYQKATQTTSGTSSSSSSSSSSWGAKWTCNICGASNGATYSTCWDCGFPRGAQKETYQPSQLSTYETSYTPSSVWTCKICGSNNDGSASKCWYCKNAKGATNTAAATAVQKAREQAVEEQSKSLYSNKSTATQNKAPQSLNYDSLFSYGSSGAGGGTGGGGVGGADSQSKSNPQKIDWIAVRLNRIQRAISDLDAVASSGLKNLSTRIDSAKKEVTELNKEIDASNQGYNRYIQEANSVGLRSDLAERVRNGTIDINSYDDDTRQKIQEYQEWLITTQAILKPI